MIQEISLEHLYFDFKFALSVSNYLCEAQYSLHSTCLKTQIIYFHDLFLRFRKQYIYI